MANIRQLQVDVGDVELSLLAAGEGSPVVLLHGIPTSARLWLDVLPRLAAAGHQALAPNLPGYGATRTPRGSGLSFAGCARLLARWLERRGDGPAWIVGHDAGGAVAQLLAVDHPHAVSGLTLANSIADSSWPAPRARFARASARLGLHRPLAHLGVIPNGYLRRQMRRGLAAPSGPAAGAVDRIVFDGKFSDPRGRAEFQRHLAALDWRDTARAAALLPASTVPAQLVWGTADPFQPWEVAGRRLQALLPRADVILLDGCGHFAPLECPDRFTTALLARSGA